VVDDKQAILVVDNHGGAHDVYRVVDYQGMGRLYDLRVAYDHYPSVA